MTLHNVQLSTNIRIAMTWHYDAVCSQWSSVTVIIKLFYVFITLAMISYITLKYRAMAQG